MKNTENRIRIILIDDEELIRKTYARALSKNDYEVETASNSNEAIG